MSDEKAMKFTIPTVSEPAPSNSTVKDDYGKGAGEGATVKTQEASFSKSKAKV